MNRYKPEVLSPKSNSFFILNLFDYLPFKNSRLSNLLFICSKNQWRSPTAEMLFRNHPVHQARSAGTSDKARVKVNQKAIEWADVVFVMERRHKEQLNQRFAHAVAQKQLIVLDIKDNYRFGEAELVELLRNSLEEYL